MTEKPHVEEGKGGGGRRGVNNLKSKPEQLETDCKTEADTAVLVSATPTFNSDSDARQAEGPASLVLHQALVVPRIPLVALVDHQRFLQELDRNMASGHETARVQWNPFLTEPDFSDSQQVTPLVLVTCTHTCAHARTHSHTNTCMHMRSLSHEHKCHPPTPLSLTYTHIHTHIKP